MSPGPVTKNQNWICYLNGSEQQQVQRLVEEASEKAGVPITGIRTAYSPNAAVSFYDTLDDDVLALVLTEGTFNHMERATQRLVAVHELLHARDNGRFGYRTMSPFAGNARYEMEIEKEAFQLFDGYYYQQGLNLPQETIDLHGTFINAQSGGD